MSFLEVDRISRQLDGVDILKEISFIQQPFQKIAITGETGSGKSTLLKIIAGLTQPQTGSVRLNNVPVQGPAEKLIPGHPGIAYLSQQYELPKFLSVAQVLGYASKLSEQASQHLYEVCHITHLLNRKTDQLSGGEQQRIALARLLTGSPGLLLLDEPFSNLDMIHKLILKQVIRDMSGQLRITCILVSHDPLDTVSWADEMIVLKNGTVVQQGPPEEVYRRPVNEYTAALFGKYNLLSPALSAAFSALGNASTGGKQLLIRPEQFTMSVHSIRGLPAVVREIFFTGSAYEYELLLGNEAIMVRTAGNNIAKGEMVHVYVSPGGVWGI